MPPSPDTYPRKFGKYQLLGPLAQGGMGALYLAATGDMGLERLLVIKTVLPHLADAEYVARFRDEAKVVVKLSHGNLIPVFDAGQVDGELFLAMDFVEGKDLRAIWNRCAKVGVAFPVDVAVYLVKELSRGLAYAHKYGGLELVHRDVSPPNILLSYSGEVKLTDFGLAASTLKMEKTAPGIIYGKVAYMSPEQARGEPLDGRSDLYAAGIILWELLTGRQLFPPGQDSPQELLRRAKNPEVLKPSHRAPRVPPELDGICLKALAADREQRYADGEEFRQALTKWLASESPMTGSAKVERFLHKLFGDEMVEERLQREDLILKIRERIKTLPPSHELRRALAEDGIEADRNRSGELGRRAADRGQDAADRRRQNRRGSSPPWDVPAMSADGRTVVPAQDGSGAASAVVAQQRAPSELVGMVLDGRYRLVELIGEGGMGRVYLAEHVEIGKQVAVKVLHQVYSRMPELVERFRREARAASRIGHPHIVDVTDSGATQDGSVYFVMEYLEGVDVGTVIDRQGAIETQRALRIGSQICQALAAAHAAGIIHRDLKPDNVFLTMRHGTADFVKVLDFGIAKSSEAEEARTQRLTQPGLAMGTPEYMAPEQAAGKHANERSDIYSCAAIIYEMLTGRPPYSGQNFMEVLSKKATEEPPPIRGISAEVPQAVERVVLEAMSREPEKRPLSMEAFDYELTKCLAGRGAAVARVLGLRNEGPSGQTGFRPGTVTPAPEFLGADRGSVGSLVTGRPRWLFPGIAAATVLTAGAVLFWALSGPGEVETTPGPVAVVVPPERPPGADAALEDGNVSGIAVADGEEPPLELNALDLHAEIPFFGPQLPDAVEGEERGDVGTETDSERGGATKPIRGGPPASRAAADRLLREARAAKAKMDWRRAQRLYQRVASGRHRRQAGNLGLAEIAFETKQNKTVIRYAKKAGKSTRALLLLGHAYFKQGDYKTALKYYEQVTKKSPGNREAKQSAEAARRRLGK